MTLEKKSLTTRYALCGHRQGLFILSALVVGNPASF